MFGLEGKLTKKRNLILNILFYCIFSRNIFKGKTTKKALRQTAVCMKR